MQHIQQDLKSRMEDLDVLRRLQSLLELKAISGALLTFTGYFNMKNLRNSTLTHNTARFRRPCVTVGLIA